MNYQGLMLRAVQTLPVACQAGIDVADLVEKARDMSQPGYAATVADWKEFADALEAIEGEIAEDAAA